MYIPPQARQVQKYPAITPGYAGDRIKEGVANHVKQGVIAGGAALALSEMKAPSGQSLLKETLSIGEKAFSKANLTNTAKNIPQAIVEGFKNSAKVAAKVPEIFNSLPGKAKAIIAVATGLSMLVGLGHAYNVGRIDAKHVMKQTGDLNSVA